MGRLPRKTAASLSSYLAVLTNDFTPSLICRRLGWVGHKSVRHTTETIKFVESMKGEDAVRIALLHILIDNQVLDCEWLDCEIVPGREWKTREE
jgi:hypothetical protein